MLEIFQAQRPRLFGIAYRMTGSAGEAEDILQETWLRFQTLDAAEIHSAEALLTTIVTRLCLDHLKSAQARREVYPGLWLPEPVSTGQNTAEDPLDNMLKLESISLAFLHLLESLSPEERAVFLLREVFDYEYREIASFINKSETACRQLFSRAKKHVADHRPRFPTSPAEHERVLNTFVVAVESGDLDQLMAVMAEDVVCYADGGGKATAAARPLHGREQVAKFVKGVQKSGFKPGDTIEMPLINGRTGFLVRNAEGAITTVLTLDIVDGVIDALYFIRNPDKLQHLA
ncbi:MAG: RNA polymerase sigma-70 factor [Caldilineaceae bacterium]